MGFEVQLGWLPHSNSLWEWTDDQLFRTPSSDKTTLVFFLLAAGTVWVLGCPKQHAQRISCHFRMVVLECVIKVLDIPDSGDFVSESG